MIDLAHEQGRAAGGLAIRRMLDPGAMGIDIATIAADHKGFLV